MGCGADMHVPRAIAAALLVTAFLPGGSAVAEPQADFWVEADYTISFSTLSNLTVSASLEVRKATVDGRAYAADEIRDSYQGIPKYPGLQRVRDEFKAELTDAVRDAFRDGLASIFPDALTRTVDETRLVSALEAASDADPYDPPVAFALAATIENDRESLGLGGLSGDAVQAVFSSGARIRIDTDLAADPGFNNTFTLMPPFGLTFQPAVTPSAIAQEGRGVRVALDNWQGTFVDSDVYPLELLDSSARAPTMERIESEVTLGIGSFSASGGEIPVTVEVSGQVASLALGARAPGALPGAVKFDAVAADGIRALYDTGGITDADLEVAEEALFAKLKGGLASTLGASVEISGGFDRGSLRSGYAEPHTGGDPVPFTARATATYRVEGLAGDDAQTAFDIGATVGLPVEVVAEAGHVVAYAIRVPDGLTFSPHEKGVVTDNGRVARFEVDNADGATVKEETVNVRIRSANAPFLEKDAKLLITVDLADVDVSATKAAGGDFGAIKVNVLVDGSLGVIEVPEEFRASLPAGVEIDQLSSDAIRLLLDRGLIDEATVDSLEAGLLSKMEAELSNVVGRAVTVGGGLDEATLGAGLVSTPLSGDKPIVFQARTSFDMPLAGGSPRPTAAISLYSVPLSFNLQKVEDLDTTYKFILPKGLALDGAPVAQGGETATGKENGRDYFTVTPGEEAAVTTFSVAVTPAFVAMKFWPVLLGVVLLLGIIVGVPIWILRGRGGKGGAG